MSTAVRSRGVSSLHVFCAVLLLVMLVRHLFEPFPPAPALGTAATMFVAVYLQALPFLVFGVLLSGAIAAFVPPSALHRALPANPSAAVGVAGAAGLVLPGCECASVPVARRLMGQGVPDAVALTFLLAAPAVNPVVLVATAVAFPEEPGLVVARLIGSLATACVMGWLWQRIGKREWIVQRARRPAPVQQDASRWAVFVETARHDLVSAGGFLVLGGVVAAALGVLVPRPWMDALGSSFLLAIVVMAVLAVLLALCSEADAFVAASMSALPLVPRLVFLVVGPAVDVKLIALQAGAFGRGFAARFAPATFLIAVLCGTGAGLLVIGVR